MASLRIDPQGKAYGQMALEMMIAAPQSWVRDLHHETGTSEAGASAPISAAFHKDASRQTEGCAKSPSNHALWEFLSS